MRLPDLVAYQTAVQHPATAFADADLRAATVTTNRLGLPRVAAGNFALTYQLCTGGRRWAVRCFHRDAADRARRYAAISQALASLGEGPLVTIAYLPVGVSVEHHWYPVTKMPWLDGRPLNRAVEARLDSPAELARLERRFIALTARLRQLGLAHGDLQHGNILVDRSGDLKLVDYDGMYVPALQGLPASESGDPNYQHPGRRDQFDAELDRFAALVIVTALRVLAQVPDLWRTYNTDDNLLFRRADFVAPETSRLFRELSSRAGTRELAERFARVCQDDCDRVPLLVDFLRSEPRVGLAASPHAPVASRTAAGASVSVPTLRPADVVALNRLYTPARRPQRPPRRSWSLRRAVAQEALAFTPDGLLLATADRTGKVRLREAGSGRVAQVWSASQRLTELACSPDGRRLLAGGPEGGLRVWALKGHGMAQQVSTPTGAVRSLAFGPAGPLVAVATGPAISLCEAGTGRRLRLTGFRAEVVGLALSVDGRVLAAGAADGSLRCWSLPGGGLLAATRQQGAVTAVALAGDGRLLASADAAGVVRLWAVPGGRLAAELRLPTAEDVVRLAFSSDSAHLAGAGARGRLMVWDVASGAVRHTLSTPAGVASGLAFSPDGRSLAVTTQGGAVSVRSLSTVRGPKPTPVPRRRQGPVVPRVQDPRRWFMDVLRRFGATARAP
jgi:WD40 repeat protein